MRDSPGLSGRVGAVVRPTVGAVTWVSPGGVAAAGTTAGFGRRPADTSTMHVGRAAVELEPEGAVGGDRDDGGRGVRRGRERGDDRDARRRWPWRGRRPSAPASSGGSRRDAHGHRRDAGLRHRADAGHGHDEVATVARPARLRRSRQGARRPVPLQVSSTRTGATGTRSAPRGRERHRSASPSPASTSGASGVPVQNEVRPTAPSHESERCTWLRWQVVSYAVLFFDAVGAAALEVGPAAASRRTPRQILLFQPMYMTPRRRAIAAWLPSASVASSQVEERVDLRLLRGVADAQHPVEGAALLVLALCRPTSRTAGDPDRGGAVRRPEQGSRASSVPGFAVGEHRVWPW